MKWGGLLVGLAALVVVAPAAADDWWPHPNDVSWEYSWQDSVYATTPTKEKVTLKSQKGKSFTLQWTTDKESNPDDAIAGNGTMDFTESTFGFTNTNWSSTPPPSDFPILCPSAAQCGNTLSDTLYYLIWGSRAPVLFEPLLKGETWSSTGGQANDITSTSTYEGTEQVTVPAFKDPVTAAKVRTDVTQAGAQGDPYGSGVRTIWWVFGVGPVKMTFQHAGGTNAALTTSELQTTRLTPKTQPDDTNYFPLTKGETLRYRWTNTKHLKKPEVEEFNVDASINQTARFVVKNISGPIRVAGSYVYSTRVDGVTNVAAATKAATLAKLPPLGPKSAPKDQRRHFFTPFDLMNFGMNPILTAYPSSGDTWATNPNSRDFSVYGVNGSSKILGLQTVTVPAGTFHALAIQSTLNQPAFPFGSGTRTSWFAPDKGLVKLVFRHGDKSTSTVVLLK
jgi:hypothetical protein